MRKTNMPKGIARMAMTAGLTGAMLLGGMATSVTPALADTGSITVAAQNNDDPNAATYKAYQVFVGDTRWDATAERDYISHVAWANNLISGPVSTFVKNWDGNSDGVKDYEAFLLAKYGVADKETLNNTWTTNGTAPEDIPLNVAEFISLMIGEGSPQSAYNVSFPGSDTAEGTTTTPRTTAGKTFANELAQTIAASSANYSTATAGTAFSGDEGYWLLVTTPNTIDVDEAGTAPIWTTLSEHAKSISEKTAIPTVNKQVLDDATGAEWGKIADSNTSQDLDYKITATLPENLDAFESYHMTLADTLPAGMALAIQNGETEGVDGAGSVRVTVGGQDITSHLNREDHSYGTIAYANNVLTVDITNLLANYGAGYTPFTKDDQIVVTYKAHLKPGANLGQTGNDNVVELTYSSDPNVETATQKATAVNTKTTAYALDLNKVDKDTRQNLAGAKFICTVGSGSNLRYIKSDGSMVDYSGDATETAYAAAGLLFTTGDNGHLVINGLDEGEYTLTEVTAPQGYELIDRPMVATITATKNQTEGTLTSLAASQAGGETDVLSNTPGAVPAHLDGIVSMDPATGVISSRLSDDREVKMPLTGMSGRTALFVYGGAAVGISAVAIAVYAAKRRKKDEYEYEWVE